MGHHYISLGAACNAATMMKIAGLRRASYPFDWLLNHKDGLSAVTAIIQDDFRSISEPDCYITIYNADVGRSVPAYKSYPDTFHVHSDPSTDSGAHDEMMRRFDRMRSMMKSPETLHFVYYRDLSVCRASKCGISAESVYEIMRDEAIDFLTATNLMNSGNAHMLLVLESDVDDVPEVVAALEAIEDIGSRIVFGRAISRYDDIEALNNRWQREWIDLIIHKTHMPFWLQARCRIKRAWRQMKQRLKVWRTVLVGRPVRPSITQS